MLLRVFMCNVCVCLCECELNEMHVLELEIIMERRNAGCCLVEGIRVLCRLRPALKDEQGLAECVFPTTTTMTTDSPSSSSSSSSSVVQLIYRGRMKSFEVDHIIPSTDDSQQRVCFIDIQKIDIHN